MTAATFNTRRKKRKKNSQLARPLPPEVLLEIARLVQSSQLPQQPPDLAPFDAIVGKLVAEAFAASATRRLSKGQWESIAAQADAAGFRLKENLEQQAKLILASWNQQQMLTPDKLITTFLRALKSKQQKLRRGALRRLYRAKDNYLGIHSEMSGS